MCIYLSPNWPTLRPVSKVGLICCKFSELNRYSLYVSPAVKPGLLVSNASFPNTGSCKPLNKELSLIDFWFKNIFASPKIIKLVEFVTTITCSLYTFLISSHAWSSDVGINFLDGWNIIAYPCLEPFDAVQWFGEMTNNNQLQIVKNYSAEVYWPEYYFNGIGDLQPGEGYQVRANIWQK